MHKKYRLIILGGCLVASILFVLEGESRKKEAVADGRASAKAMCEEVGHSFDGTKMVIDFRNPPYCPCRYCDSGKVIDQKAAGIEVWTSKRDIE
jgi:hypothetical protein